MDIRNEWIAGTDPVDRMVEFAARSLVAAALWVVVLYGVLELAGASVEWFTGLGVIAPLFWLLKWVYPEASCSGR